MTNSFQLGIDSFNGNNFVQAYSYFNICLQEEYDNPQAHFYKGLCAAYNSNLLNLNTQEMLHEYSIAVNIFIKEEYDSTQVASAVIHMCKQMLDFIINYHNLALNHKSKFPDLESTYKNYWDICVKLLDVSVKISEKIPFEFVSVALLQYNNFIKTFEKNIDIICSNAEKNGEYRDGIAVSHSMIDGSAVYSDKYSTIYPPYEVKEAISAWEKAKEYLDDMSSAASKHQSLDHYFDEKKTHQEEVAHSQAISNKVNANMTFKSEIISNIKMGVGGLLFGGVFIALGIWLKGSSDGLFAFLEVIAGWLSILFGVGIALATLCFGIGGMIDAKKNIIILFLMMCKTEVIM